eukprot:3530253-Amphidinium_carterae.1
MQNWSTSCTRCCRRQLSKTLAVSFLSSRNSWIGLYDAGRVGGWRFLRTATVAAPDHELGMLACANASLIALASVGAKEEAHAFHMSPCNKFGEALRLGNFAINLLASLACCFQSALIAGLSVTSSPKSLTRRHGGFALPVF